MKKALAILLLVLFVVGLYFNFVHTGSTSDKQANENQDAETTTDDSTEEETANDNSTSDSDSQEQNTNDIAFKEPSIQELYDQRLENNEALIIDVLTPSYYNSDFVDRLSESFPTYSIQVNQVDMPGNTVEMNELTVNENSDIVIMDAMQIADYNDEVLPERNRGNLSDAYMDLYNSDKIVIILGDANVHEHENLMNTLNDDAEFFVNNDYFYIDNKDVSVEDPYNEDDNVLNPELEDAVIENIRSYLLQ